MATHDTAARSRPTLWAISDLHVGHTGNRPVTESLYPSTPDDWLIVAGDVAERTDEIRWSLDLLRKRFAKVIWVPGNHELWTTGRDPVQVACPLAGAEAPLCGSFLRLTDLAPVSWPQLLQGRSTEIIYTRDSTLVDSDGDGIVDSQDRCAASPAGRAVDSAGCAIGQG